MNRKIHIIKLQTSLYKHVFEITYFMLPNKEKTLWMLADDWLKVVDNDLTNLTSIINAAYINRTTFYGMCETLSKMNYVLENDVEQTKVEIKPDSLFINEDFIISSMIRTRHSITKTLNYADIKNMFTKLRQNYESQELEEGEIIEDVCDNNCNQTNTPNERLEERVKQLESYLQLKDSIIHAKDTQLTLYNSMMQQAIKHNVKVTEQNNHIMNINNMDMCQQRENINAAPHRPKLEQFQLYSIDNRIEPKLINRFKYGYCCSKSPQKCNIKPGQKPFIKPSQKPLLIMSIQCESSAALYNKLKDFLQQMSHTDYNINSEQFYCNIPPSIILRKVLSIRKSLYNSL